MTVCEKSDPVTLRNLEFWEDFTLACKTLLLLVSLSGITKKKNHGLISFWLFLEAKLGHFFIKKDFYLLLTYLLNKITNTKPKHCQTG